jgi:hypothetical protein
LSVSERKRLTDDLLNGIRKMSERGDTIIATVVALDPSSTLRAGSGEISH